MPYAARKRTWVKKWVEEVQVAKTLLRQHWDVEDWRATSVAWALQSISYCPVGGTSQATSFGPDSLHRLNPAEPALLLQLMSSGWDFEGMSPQALRTRFRNERLLLTTPMGSPDTSGVCVSCASFVEYMLAQDEPGDKADEEPIAVFDRDVLYDNPELSALYSVPHVPQLSIGDLSLDLLPPTVRPALRYFLLGPSRSGTEMHRDPAGTVAWNALVHGCKRWVFLAPEASEKLALRQNPPEGFVWSLAEWFDQEWPKICEDALYNGWTTFDFLQRPGEIVYTPVGWWHAVLNLEASVAITHNVICSAVFQKTIQTHVGADNPIAVSEAMVVAAIEAFDLNDHDGEVRTWLSKILFAQWLDGLDEDANAGVV